MVPKASAQNSDRQNDWRRLLSRTAILERARDSWIYDLYWSVANPRIIDDRKKEIAFYRNLLEGLRKDDLIFDIGANQGYKAGIFLRLGARVVAVEPDDTSQETLRRKFLAYRLKKRNLAIVPKAVSDRSSVEVMWIDTPGGAKNTLSRKWVEALSGDDNRFGERLQFGRRKEVETVSMNDLISAYGAPFFIKIDVEGHELNALRGLKQAVPYLSFEVNLPEFRTEGGECIKTLNAVDPDGVFNYTPDCRRGFVLDSWVQDAEMSAILDSCTEESIEIFWKTRP
ncbi:MAG TPA: FkbM family methyltransferase [Candidatus Limnocylindrales bacterium]|nr:FkbM family methyltransferase [Candidatus Limnocylindrales bacterium]